MQAFKTGQPLQPVNVDHFLVRCALFLLLLIAKVDIKGLLAELSHGPIVDNAEVLAAWVDSWRALLEFFEIEHGHLLDVHVGLIIRDPGSRLVRAAGLMLYHALAEDGRCIRSEGCIACLDLV